MTFWDGENVTLLKVVGDLQRLGIKRSLWITWWVIYFSLFKVIFLRILPLEIRIAPPFFGNILMFSKFSKHQTSRSISNLYMIRILQQNLDSCPLPGCCRILVVIKASEGATSKQHENMDHSDPCIAQNIRSNDIHVTWCQNHQRFSILKKHLNEQSKRTPERPSLFWKRRHGIHVVFCCCRFLARLRTFFRKSKLETAYLFELAPRIHHEKPTLRSGGGGVCKKSWHVINFGELLIWD